MRKFDKIIIGAGIYGLYAATISGEKGNNVLVIEKEKESFTRATYVNQARVHMGYHYPRSYTTAIKSANYFEKFIKNYPESIMGEFDQIYATSTNFSWTNAKQFAKFCNNANIMCEALDRNMYFKENMCDGAFLTKEYTYDAKILLDSMMGKIDNMDNVKIVYETDILELIKSENTYQVFTDKGDFESNFILNATYASVNQILKMLNFEPFKIKYELCEIILCKVNNKLKNIGLTVMDGPFFSIMPFGKTDHHSLTSVTFTPHVVSYDELPTFECQKGNEDYCTPWKLGNCNSCSNKPKTSWLYMSNLAKKYMQQDMKFTYEYSLFSLKPILLASEIDDSRPTVIKQHSSNPYFFTVLSGKINTIYDLEEIL